MVARARPINWSLLLDPSSQAANTATAAGARLGSAIGGVGEDIGGAMVRSRQEKESKRRFEANQADELRRENAANMRSDRDFSLRKQEHDDAMLEKARDRQASDTTLLDLVTGSSEQAQAEAMATGQVNPETADILRQSSDALGGPEATHQRLSLRAASGFSQGDDGVGLLNIFPRSGPNGDGGGASLATPVSRTPAPDAVQEVLTDDEKAAKARMAGSPNTYAPGGNLPGSPPGSNFSLRPGAENPTLRPETVSLRPTPVVGEAGVPMAPSDEKYGEADRIEREARSLADRKRRIERELDTGKNVSREVRAKAQLEISRLDTALAALSERHGSATRQADQAKAKEEEAAAVARKHAEKQEAEIAKAKDQANDLVAWGGADMSRFKSIDYADENVRREIDVWHTREMADHTAAALKAERDRLPDSIRTQYEAFVEAHPDSGIKDASGLSDKDLREERKRLYVRDYQRERDAVAATGKKQSQENVDTDDARAARKEVDAKETNVLRDLDAGIADLDKTLLAMKQDDPRATEMWAKRGRMASDRDALVTKRKADLAALSAPIAREDARAVFDREVKKRGIDPNSDAARTLAEDIKAGRVR